MRISDWSSDVCSSDLFIILLLEKMFGHFLPVRFLMFAAVGCIGLLVHLFVLGLTLNMGGEGFRYAQALAIFVAMTFNFIVNNALRSEEHTSELQSLMRTSYAVFCLQKKTISLSTHRPYVL